MFVLFVSTEPDALPIRTLVDLMDAGVVRIGNYTWKLVDDGIGFVLYRNGVPFLVYAYRSRVAEDIFKDIKKFSKDTD